MRMPMMTTGSDSVANAGAVMKTKVTSARVVRSGTLGGPIWRLPFQFCVRPPARRSPGGGCRAGNLSGGAQRGRKICRTVFGEELAGRHSEKQDLRSVSPVEPRGFVHGSGLLC